MRSFNRMDTDQTIQCIVAGETCDAQLYNLSSGGCMIEIDRAELAKGDSIEVRLKTGTKMDGTIAWRVDQNAGVKFDHPLHQKVIQACGQWDVDEPFDRDDMRDRFGLPLMSMQIGGPDLIQPDDQSICFTPARK